MPFEFYFHWSAPRLWVWTFLKSIDLYNFLELSGMSEDKTQVVEKPVAKKEHSYTYWVDEKNRSRELPE